MLFIVEVTLDGHLGEQMGNMRTWLDHKRYAAISFRRTSPDLWHVDFESASRDLLADGRIEKLISDQSNDFVALIAPGERVMDRQGDQTGE
jgi:hypothetical protein